MFCIDSEMYVCRGAICYIDVIQCRHPYSLMQRHGILSIYDKVSSNRMEGCVLHIFTRDESRGRSVTLAGWKVDSTICMWFRSEGGTEGNNV
jgi:hypothetical protein